MWPLGKINVQSKINLAGSRVEMALRVACGRQMSRWKFKVKQNNAKYSPRPMARFSGEMGDLSGQVEITD